MKIHTVTACLLALLCARCLSAAPVNYEDKFIYNTFSKRTGKWDVAANWSLKHAPAAGEDAIIRDNTGVIIDKAVPTTRSILLGGKGLSALTISKGGVLALERQLRIGRTEAGTGGVLALEGGSLVTGLGSTTSRLSVGDSLTFSSTGRAYLRSGTFQGSIVVGSAMPNTGVGTLSIVGSSVNVGARQATDNMYTTPYGTVEFILDAKGVATIDYKNTVVSFWQGSHVRVMGDDYQGPSQTIVLIAAKKILNKGFVVECTGFPDKYKVKTEIDRRGLVLTIQAK